MHRIKYKSHSYILDETPEVSGKIAFEFLSLIVTPNDSLKFILSGQKNQNDTIDSLLQMYNNPTILINKRNEKEFFINNIEINDKLLEILCLLGTFPNSLVISKLVSNKDAGQVNYSWRIESCDEIFRFIYLDHYFDDSTISFIEKKLDEKNITYERKGTKTIWKYK